jgi:hypothetical protein
MSQFSNEAAWQTAAGAKPFKLGPGPSPDPAENEVVIKVAYAAVNPVDWKASIINLNYQSPSNNNHSFKTAPISNYHTPTSSVPT